MLYSQLFAYTLANIHSNAVEGDVLKVNCYNGMIDGLQIDVSQSPLEPLDLVKRILALIEGFPSHRKFVDVLKRIHSDVRDKINSLLFNCGTMEAAPSPVRAEFRFPLEKCMSMARLLDFFFAEDFIARHTVVLDMGRQCD